MSLLSLLTRKPVKGQGPWPDDLKLIEFGNHKADVFTLRDAKQSIAIFGELGSGKTSGSGHLFAKKFLANGLGGLVLCFDISEADLWRKYLKESGREADGRFFSESGPHRLNFLDYEAKAHGVNFTENLVWLLTDMASVEYRVPPSGESNGFWQSQKRKLLRNAISLMQMAGEDLQLRKLHDMILSAPGTAAEVDFKEWKDQSYLFYLMSLASHKNGKSLEYRYVKDYWYRERPNIPSKTRGTIDADLTGMLDPLTRGKIGELFGTTTNLSPEDILDGKIVVIDIPVSFHRQIGQYAGVIWSQVFQRAVDRRKYAPPYDRPVFLWQDEAHWFATESDAMFQTTLRKKGIIAVRLSQNLANYLKVYGNENAVNTLLGNHASKIWHRNGEPGTNEWASRVIGKKYRAKHSLSMGAENGKMSASVNEAYEDSCPPHLFKDLLNGGEENDKTVEGIIFKTGRKWKGDLGWTKMRFEQTD